jgi:hypothetical protein
MNVKIEPLFFESSLARINLRIAQPLIKSSPKDKPYSLGNRKFVSKYILKG